MPEFSIKKQMLGKDMVAIHVSGFLDAHTFEQMEETIEGLFEQKVYRIIVDLSKVNYISSAGCGVFIGAIGEAQENGGDIILLSPTPNVMEVFELLGLNHIFAFSTNLTEAQGAFAKAK